MTIEEFADRIRHCWSRTTSFFPEEWNQNNPARGQCLVTALVARDIFGGSIVKGLIAGEEHYWNFLRKGGEVDFTREQFGFGPHSTQVLACTKYRELLGYPFIDLGVAVLTDDDILNSGNPANLYMRYCTLRAKFAFDEVFPWQDIFHQGAFLRSNPPEDPKTPSSTPAWVRQLNCSTCGGAGLLPGKPSEWDSLQVGESGKVCPTCKDGKE